MEEQNIRAYEKQRNGRFVLALLCVVTLVNQIVRLCGASLVFPCSVYVPRFLYDLESCPSSVAITVCALICLTLFLAWTAAGNKQFAHMRAFRALYIFYIADSIFYFGMNVGSMTADSGRLAFVIELAFRLYCIYSMFEADRVHGNPARYEKPTPEQLQKVNEKQTKKPASKQPSDDDDDEGIQW